MFFFTFCFFFFYKKVNSMTERMNNNAYKNLCFSVFAFSFHLGTGKITDLIVTSGR